MAGRDCFCPTFCMLCVRPNCPQLTKLHLQKETHFIQFGTYTNMTVGQVYALDLTKHNGVLICLMARGPFFKYCNVRLIGAGPR